MLANTLEALIDIQALQNQDAEDRYITDGVSWQRLRGIACQAWG